MRRTVLVILLSLLAWPALAEEIGAALPRGSVAEFGFEVRGMIDVVHVLEPPDLWTRYMPERFKDRAPWVETVRGCYEGGTNFRFRRTDEGKWASVWRYEDYEMTVNPGFAAAGFVAGAVVLAAGYVQQQRRGEGG
jgi:hypothetical protein